MPRPEYQTWLTWAVLLLYPPPESLIPSPATVHHLPGFQDVFDNPPATASPVKAQCILWSCLQTFMREHWAKRTSTQQVHMNVIHLLPPWRLVFIIKRYPSAAIPSCSAIFAATVIMRPNACSCFAVTSLTVGIRMLGMIRICVGA